MKLNSLYEHCIGKKIAVFDILELIHEEFRNSNKNNISMEFFPELGYHTPNFKLPCIIAYFLFSSYIHDIR